MSRHESSFCNALVTFMPDYIGPPDPQTLIISQESLKKLGGISKVFGCIDWTHVRIQAPVHDEDVYVNRKNPHSINVKDSVGSCDQAQQVLSL